MISTLLGRLGERQRDDAGASAGASEIMRSSSDSSYEPAFGLGSRAITSMVIAEWGRIPPQEDKAVLHEIAEHGYILVPSFQTNVGGGGLVG
jgi:hypothetical protein